MFKFNFSELDLEDDNDQSLDSLTVTEPASEQGNLNPSGTVSGTHSSASGTKGVERSNSTSPYAELERAKAYELSLDDLSQALPPAFSYSPLVIPLSGDAAFDSEGSSIADGGQKNTSGNITLLRRDLFDARYQLISEDDANVLPADSAHSIDGSQTPGAARPPASQKHGDALEFIDNPSDLVPSVYEGGLKTWECSLDLVDCLASLGDEGRRGADWMRGKRVIEIGCGTAVPSLYLLHTLFSHSRTAGSGTDTLRTEFVLQDYNDLVLRLVTLPNMLLTWYASPLAEAYRSQHTSTDEPDESTFDSTQPGDMHIKPELLSAFRASLREQGISIRFIAGSWETLSNDNALCAFPFDVTLTSETIYQTYSLPSLIGLLKRAATSSGGDSDDRNVQMMARDLSLENCERLCWVAAKVLYFGVGGGIMDFERAVSESGGKTRTVLQRKAGVGRRVMSVEWT